MEPVDFENPPAETTISESRATVFSLAHMGVRHAEVEDVTLIAQATPCPGPVQERCWRIPFLGIQFGPLIVRCANTVIPWDRFPNSRYPGRKALTRPAKNA